MHQWQGQQWQGQGAPLYGPMNGPMHAQRPSGSVASQALLPAGVGGNPYHPVTVTRMGAHGADHDLATGRPSGARSVLYG